MDPAQGLCLGALFDIAATNVNLHSICVQLLELLYIFVYEFEILVSGA